MFRRQLPRSVRYPAYRRIRQLLYLLGAGVLVFSLVAMAWTLRDSYVRMAGDAQHDVATSASVSATQVARLMDRVANVSQQILRDRDFRRCLSRNQWACVEQHLSRALEGSPEVASLVIVDVDGRKVADSIPESVRERRFNDHILLSKALASESFLIGSLHTDLATRGRILPMLHGLADEQGRKFVLIAAINLAVLDTSLVLDDREWRRTLILFRSDGAVLLSRPSWLRLESVIGTLFYRAAFLEQSSGQSEEVLQSGSPLLRGGWAVLNDWPLGVYVGVEAREIRKNGFKRYCLCWLSP